MEEELKTKRGKKQKQVTEVYVQTENYHNNEDAIHHQPSIFNLAMRGTCKSLVKTKTVKEVGFFHEDECRRSIKMGDLEISQETYYCYDPAEVKQRQLKGSDKNSSMRSSVVKKISKDKMFERREPKESKEVKFSIKKVVTEAKESVRDSLESPSEPVFPDLKMLKTETITELVNESKAEMEKENF